MDTEFNYLYEDKYYENAVKNLKSTFYDVVEREEIMLNNLENRIAQETDDGVKARLLELWSKQNDSLDQSIIMFRQLKQSVRVIDSFVEELSNIDKAIVSDIINSTNNIRTTRIQQMEQQEVYDQPVMEKQVQEEAVEEQPVVEEQVQEEVVEEQPVVEEQVQEEIVEDQPVVEEQVQEEVVEEQPVVEEQTQEEVVEEQPVVEEQTQEEVVEEQPVVEEQVQEEVVEEQPVVEEQVQEEVVEEQPVVEEQVQEEVVEEQPVVEENNEEVKDVIDEEISMPLPAIEPSTDVPQESVENNDNTTEESIEEENQPLIPLEDETINTGNSEKDEEVEEPLIPIDESTDLENVSIETNDSNEESEENPVLENVEEQEDEIHFDESFNNEEVPEMAVVNEENDGMDLPDVVEADKIDYSAIDEEENKEDITNDEVIEIPSKKIASDVNEDFDKVDISYVCKEDNDNPKAIIVTGSQFEKLNDSLETQENKLYNRGYLSSELINNTNYVLEKETNNNGHDNQLDNMMDNDYVSIPENPTREDMEGLIEKAAELYKSGKKHEAQALYEEISRINDEMHQDKGPELVKAA